MVAAFLLLATAGEPMPPPILVRPTPPTVEETVVAVTRPAFDLDCSVVDALRSPYALAIEQRGGRGYVDPRVNHPLRRIRSTASSFRVLTDETGIFEGRDLTGQDAGGIRVESRHPEFGVVRLRTFPAGPNRVAALVYVNGLAIAGETGFVRYTGFCDITRHAQTPLTDAEAAEVLAQ